MSQYIDLINRFWQEVEMKDFLPSEACVYFRILDVCNKLGWQNPFSLSNSRAVALMAMNEKTFRAMRDKLGGRGLIEFRKGKRRESAPLYCLPTKTEDGWVFDWGNFLEVKNTAKNTANDTAKLTAKLTAKSSAKRPAINKTKDIDILSLDSSGACACTREDFSSDVLAAFFSDRRQSKIEAFCMKHHTDVSVIRVVADEIVAEWGFKGKEHPSIEDAMEHLANTIAIRIKNPKKNEDNQTDRLSARRGTEPKTKERKGFKGTF